MAMTRTRGIRAAVIATALLALSVPLSLLVGSVANVHEYPILAPERIAREATVAWVARVMLVLIVAWLVIGALASRSALVRRPGAAAARVSWLSASRPWRARESVLGLLDLDRILLVVVPVLALGGTAAVATAFFVPWPVLLVVACYAIFAVVTILFVLPRSPWPVIATIGGTVLPQCAVVLAGVAIAGPLHLWVWIWTVPALRVLIFSLVFALMVWMIVAAAGAVNQQIGPRRATATTLVASGMALLVPFVTIAILGPERTGADWGDRVVELTLAESAITVPMVISALLVLAGIAIGPRPPKQR